MYTINPSLEHCRRYFGDPSQRHIFKNLSFYLKIKNSGQFHSSKLSEEGCFGFFPLSPKKF